jgi:hypothetical protein
MASNYVALTIIVRLKVGVVAGVVIVRVIVVSVIRKITVIAFIDTEPSHAIPSGLQWRVRDRNRFISIFLNWDRTAICVVDLIAKT